MSKYTKARFWKCALQVNPAGYIEYRGEDHGLNEEQYNNELLRICQDEGIKVIGLADHGNVDAVDEIRKLMNDNDIVVFPGFEIASSEKAHFVCLFPEDTSKDLLNRYLGNLDLLDPENGVRPSRLGAEELLRKVDEIGGLSYAAHCIDDNGVLYRKLNHVWKCVHLKAAQIPGTVDDLRTDAGNAYRQILLNKDPHYKREKPIGIINAKDVARPEDLINSKASCLIKMTKPCFASFKQAFLDPDSRVRLNSDVPENYYSRIESVHFVGGYLNDIEIEFSEHLNAVIGGRGTGKSTLIECLRYALEKRPNGKNAERQHDEIIKENLGKEKGRVEVAIRSSTMNGKRFIISRRYGESTIVKDESGNISTFTSNELLPRLEIYGQNEIYEIAQDQQGQLKLFKRFLDVDNTRLDERLSEISVKMHKSRSDILGAQQHLADIEDEVANLPKLLEQVAQFKELGLEERLKIVPKLEQEKRLSKRVGSELEELENALAAFKELTPDTVYLSDASLEDLPHAEQLKQIKSVFDGLKNDLQPVVSKIDSFMSETKGKVSSLQDKLQADIDEDEANLAKAFKEIPSCEGRSGNEIGTQFQALLKEIERIRPKEALLKTRQTRLGELQRVRASLLAEMSEARAERSAKLQQALKKLNRKLSGKLRLTVAPEANRNPLMEYLQKCNMEGVGQKRLAWIESVEDFSPVKLVGLIRQGMRALAKAGCGITPTVTEALCKLTPSQLMEIEELELPDTITIELNVAHEGAENYRPLNKLSTGQQCTAILHMLLLENLDPLLMDQPEDNLDNAFIADRIVTELRSAKIARQFLFATHNANIPVFGDAEWIGVFHADENHASLPATAQGAIDLPEIQREAAEILEGGKMAFIQRKEKYGF
ncbi:MAG: AAA family ATPase [Deltaproteobacteria bacterium]|jgi:ABC-type lipoprotein export system ATPase subunit/archaellum component FlaC|nr:AAA family ATPase [Deltaproteobacteria bacterium]